MGLEDGRLALFLPVRAPNGAPVGIAMILADRKSVGDDTLERMMAAPVRAIMQRLAVLLKPSEQRAAGGTARVPVLQLDDEPELAAAVAALVPAPARSAGLSVTAVAVPAAAVVISAAEIDDILEFDLAPEAAPPAPRQETPAMPPVKAARPEAVSLELDDTQGPEELDMVELDFQPPPPKGPAARAAVPASAPVAAVAAPPAPAPPPRASAPARPAPPPAPIPVVTPAAAAAVSLVSTAALNDPNLMLELLPFAKLRAGGQTRRFQVLSRISHAAA